MAKRQRTNNDLQNTTQKPKIEQHDTNATNSREWSRKYEMTTTNSREWTRKYEMTTTNSREWTRKYEMTTTNSWSPWYSLNIAESGVIHQKSNQSIIKSTIVRDQAFNMLVYHELNSPFVGAYMVYYIYMLLKLTDTK